jgi:hypothetical protein
MAGGLQGRMNIAAHMHRVGTLSRIALGMPGNRASPLHGRSRITFPMRKNLE